VIPRSRFFLLWVLWSGLYLLLAVAGPNGPRPYWPLISQHLLQAKAWAGADIEIEGPDGSVEIIPVDPRLDLTPYFAHRVVRDPRENGVMSNIAVRIPGPGGRLVPAQDRVGVGDTTPESLRCDLGFPPGPAFILFPLYLLLGSFLATGWLGPLLGGLAVASADLLFERWADMMGVSTRGVLRKGFPILAGGGTLLMWAAVDGGTFLFAQTIGLSFLTLALALAASSRPLSASLAFGLALTSRPATLGALALYLFLGTRGRVSSSGRRLVALLTGPAILGSITLLLNQLRFGSPFRFGYHAMLVPPFLRQRLAEHGQLSWAWLPGNVSWILLHPPVMAEHLFGSLDFPVSDPHGMGIFFVTPAFLALFFAFRPGIRAVGAGFPLFLAWVSLVLCCLPGLVYYNTGWVQWGGRFLLDGWPIFLILAGLGLSRVKEAIVIVLITLSVVSNAWGVLLAMLGLWPACCS